MFICTMCGKEMTGNEMTHTGYMRFCEKCRKVIYGDTPKKIIEQSMPGVITSQDLNELKERYNK